MLTPRQCAGVLRALGDETRLRILESLLVREKCVGELVAEVGKQQPHVSHHLRILREAGLIEGIREGQRVCYRVSPSIQRQLKDARQQAIDLGCCRISFPDEVLVPRFRSKAPHATRKAS
ncbi:MAG: winged helix-turn-helix transcriptional regulator [Nitrospirae bacterium]|nr:MAG: winged helix-turn-helix transcriptional regulator [Nitrospirota bacterium]